MKAGVVGLGLIGGSFAKAAKAAGHDVFVWNRTPETAALAVESGTADALLDGDTLRTPGGDAPDLIVVCLPPPAVVEWVEAHAGAFAPGTTVVDIAGVKKSVCDRLRKFALSKTWTFIGGHPMAGKEVSGYENSSAGLFKGASFIITPYPSTGRGPIDALEAFLLSLGFSSVVSTTPEHHDEMIAFTSQLPHVIAYSYVSDALAREHKGYSAGSFADVSRVAASDASGWTELFLENKDALLKVLDTFKNNISTIAEALRREDRAALKTFLEAAMHVKRELK